MSIDTFLLSADTTDLNYPEVRPTLDLNFARVKALDPRITFTRSSGGSYVGADGLIKLAGVNEARFDHNPVTGESLGLLVEESRSNLVTYSTYNPSWWGNTFPANATLSTGIDAPDGSNTAVRFSCTPTGSSLLRLSFPSFTPNGTTAFTCSFYARLISGTTSFANILSFDLADRIPGGNYLPFLVKDKWVRVVFTGTPSSAFVISFMDLLSDNTNNYTIDYWGAQLEAGAFPTSYIPTEASTRTRAADDASITGKNFSEWYRQDEGSINIAYRLGLKTASTRIFQINNSATGANNVLDIVSGSGVGSGGYLFINTNNVQEGFVPNSTPNESHRNTVFKVCVGYKTNDIAGINNKTRILGTDTSVIIPTGMNRVVFAQSDFSSLLCGHLQYVQYYPKRLSNAQLQVLTR